MSTRIPSSRRIAIWEAHNRQCIYCTEPILFKDLEIDHIIPEHLLKNPKVLAKVLTDYNLPSDFNLNDFKNLVPTHKKCNSRKTGMLFKKSTALYFLELATAKCEQAFNEEKKVLKRSRGERVLASLQVALEVGELTLAEVMAIMKKIESGVDSFEVIHDIQFANRIINGLLNQNEVEMLLDEPILPRKYGLEVLTMEKIVGGKTSNRAIRTCREWATSVQEGYSPKTNYDVKEQAFFQNVYAFVRAMSEARIADLSFINQPLRGIYNLDLLPVTMLPYLDSDEELLSLDQAGLTIADLVRENRVVIEEHSQHYLSLTFDYMGKAYWEILRADLNGDGIEDILLQTYSYATGGSLGFGDVALITRISNSSRFFILSSEHLKPKCMVAEI